MSGPRLLTLADVPKAMLLNQAAGWNQTAEDWRRVIELEPEGCFCIEREGNLVATATTTCYGRDLAWIGMVLTAPEFRGQGLARQLMTRALEFLDGRRVRCVKLDATDMGRPLYLQLGFVDERPIERWRREPAPAAAVARDLPAYQPDPAFDLAAFGADRSVLLASLAEGECAAISGAGFTMGRPGSHTAYFGPCVARNAATARSLVEWFLAPHALEPIFWDLLPDNQEAVSLARSCGFVRTRQLARMSRPGPGTHSTSDGDLQQIFAIAGFEVG